MENPSSETPTTTTAMEIDGSTVTFKNGANRESIVQIGRVEGSVTFDSDGNVAFD